MLTNTKKQHRMLQDTLATCATEVERALFEDPPGFPLVVVRYWLIVQHCSDGWKAPKHTEKSIRFGKRERFAYETSKPLAQCVVKALNVSGFARLLANRMVTSAEKSKDLIVSFPEITEGGTVAIVAWTPGPETPATLLTAVTDEKGDNLSSAPTERQPNPTLILFGADEASSLV
jgi:hypothetical protein